MKLNYRQIGAGTPIIILHGLFGMSDNWQSFARMLAQNNFVAYLVDLRNHGQSPHDSIHNYSVMASDVAELISDLHLQQPIVLGHSMGGKVAMQLLNDYPNMVSKLIVVDIAPYNYPIHHREIIDALLLVNLNEIKSRSEAEKILAYKIDDVGTRQFLLKNLYWITPEKLAWRFNLSVLNSEIEEVGNATWPSVPSTTEVLFVRGENSGYLDTTRYKEIEQWYPNAKFETIPNAGHWVQAEQPQLLLDAILKFI